MLNGMQGSDSCCDTKLVRGHALENVAFISLNHITQMAVHKRNCSKSPLPSGILMMISSITSFGRSSKVMDILSPG
jgi:hypothetical protein